MIHWLCDRCEPRLQKAVVRQDPYKTNQYLPRPAIFCDMLAYLESAAEDQREMIQQMLEDIADPSSDEDAPALNNGGHRHGINSVRSSGVATAFVMVWRQHSCVDVTVMAQRAMEVKVFPSQLWS